MIKLLNSELIKLRIFPSYRCALNLKKKKTVQQLKKIHNFEARIENGLSVVSYILALRTLNNLRLRLQDVNVVLELNTCEAKLCWIIHICETNHLLFSKVSDNKTVFDLLKPGFHIIFRVVPIVPVFWKCNQATWTVLWKHQGDDHRRSKKTETIGKIR